MDNNCFLCGGSSWHELGVGTSDGELQACDKCGLVRLAGSATPVNVRDYQGHDEERIFPADRDRVFAEWSAYRLTQLLDHVREARRIAEVGSGTGHFLEAATNRGIGAKGFDLADHRTRGRQAEFEVSEDPFASLGNNAWDAVVAFHVLEHCPNPPEVIRRMLGALRSGGIGFVEVPGILEHVQPPPAAIDPRHQWYFTETTLRRIIEHAGGHVVSVSRVGPTIAELSVTAQVGQKISGSWQKLKKIAPDSFVGWLRKRLRPRRNEMIDRLASIKKVASPDPRMNIPLNLCVFFRRA